ncbi:MAG: hypothetical protein V7L28_36090 [Nostoc sp.]
MTKPVLAPTVGVKMVFLVFLIIINGFVLRRRIARRRHRYLEW